MATDPYADDSYKSYNPQSYPPANPPQGYPDAQQYQQPNFVSPQPPTGTPYNPYNPDPNAQYYPAGYPQQYAQQPYAQQPYPQQPYPPHPYPYPQPMYMPVPAAGQPSVTVVQVARPIEPMSVQGTPNNPPMCGFGVAWILFIIGWIFPLCWLVGSVFVCAGNRQERTGGRANLTMVVLLIVLISLLVYFG